MAAKHVPSHKYGIWYYTGGIVLFLFFLQFVTGMALALYYVPYFKVAHTSVVEIVAQA